MTVFLGSITSLFAELGVLLGGVGRDELVHRLVWCLRLRLHFYICTWKHTE